MQGYILRIRPVREEDLLVTVLDEGHVRTLYRFYGARHSTVNVGYKIDFTVEQGSRSDSHRLRHVMHLGFPWLFQRNKMMVWQRFCGLLADHLRDVEEVDRFYFDLLEEGTAKMGRQDPVRLCLELYLELLEQEGRLHREMSCFLCEEPLGEEAAVTQGFLLSHPACSMVGGMEKEHLELLFREKSAAHLDDGQVDRLWNVMLRGL